MGTAENLIAFCARIWWVTIISFHIVNYYYTTWNSQLIFWPKNSPDKVPHYKYSNQGATGPDQIAVRSRVRFVRFTLIWLLTRERWMIWWLWPSGFRPRRLQTAPPRQSKCPTSPLPKYWIAVRLIPRFHRLCTTTTMVRCYDNPFLRCERRCPRIGALTSVTQLPACNCGSWVQWSSS